MIRSIRDVVLFGRNMLEKLKIETDTDFQCLCAREQPVVEAFAVAEPAALRVESDGRYDDQAGIWVPTGQLCRLCRLCLGRVCTGNLRSVRSQERFTVGRVFGSRVRNRRAGER